VDWNDDHEIPDPTCSLSPYLFFHPSRIRNATLTKKKPTRSITFSMGHTGASRKSPMKHQPVKSTEISGPTRFRCSLFLRNQI